MEIQREWSRIRNWWALEAPDAPREYGPPATSIEVAQTEKRLNLLFPACLRELYLMNDGVPNIFPFSYSLNSLAELVRSAEMMSLPMPELFEREGVSTFLEIPSTPAGPIKATWWNPFWIPFAENNSDRYCVDIDPAEGGTIGQVIHFSHETGPERVEAPSLSSFLRQLADDLEQKKYAFDRVQESLEPLR